MALGVHVKDGTRAGTRSEGPKIEDWTCECGYENKGAHRQCGRVVGVREGTEGQAIDGGPLNEYCGKPRYGRRRTRGARDIMDLNPTAADFEHAKRHDGPSREERSRPITRQDVERGMR